MTYWIGVLIMAGISAATPAQPLAAVSPSACMPAMRDYTHMWWADGLWGRPTDLPLIRCIQTGDYGLALDVENMKLLHLGPLPGDVDYLEAARQGNTPVLSLPSAVLELEISTGGKTYRCASSAVASPFARVEKAWQFAPLWESGQCAQRSTVEGLVFTTPDGEMLDAVARLEMMAWPDRVAFTLHAAPCDALPVAGPHPGRVEEGYCFDGTNRRDFPNDAALEPDQLTVEMWICRKSGFSNETMGWILGKNANEWADGVYGLTCQGEGLTALLNIGGGRENMHTAMAFGALQYDVWTHAAMTYDGAVLRLYVNGEERANKTIGQPRTKGSGPLVLGQRPDGGSIKMSHGNYRGLLDQVRIHARALTPEEIRARAQRPEDPVLNNGAVFSETFDSPEGVSYPPSGPWNDASLTIRLNGDGENMEETWRSPEGATLALGEDCSACLVWTPGGEGDKAARGVITASNMTDDQSLDVEWEPDRQYHRLSFGALPHSMPDLPDSGYVERLPMDRIRLTVENPAKVESLVPLMIYTDKPRNITGVSLFLRDINGEPTGIPVQLSKNWHMGAYIQSYALFRMPPESRTVCELTICYTHWGTLPAASHAQLCLVGYGGNQLWDQAAIGSWGESICYDIDRNCGPSIIDDVRPLMIETDGWAQKRWGWCPNVGGGDFLVYHNAEGAKQFLSQAKTTYLKQGPNLTDARYSALSSDGAIRCDYSVSLARTDDMNRCFHHFRYEVLKETTFTRLAFYQLGADAYNCCDFNAVAWGNRDGLTEERPLPPAEKGIKEYLGEAIPLSGDSPWISLHDAVNQVDLNGGANRGLIIREWSAQLGGSAVSKPYLRLYGAAPSALAELAPPPGLTTLKPGDFVEAKLELVIIPKSAVDYYGPNEAFRAVLERDANTWRPVLREASGNEITVDMREGVLLHAFPLRIRAEGDIADFSITGGHAWLPVTIEGLTRPNGLVLSEEKEGKIHPVDQSVYGNDFWQTNYDTATRTWSWTYNARLDDGAADGSAARRFILRPAVEKGGQAHTQ